MSVLKTFSRVVEIGNPIVNDASPIRPFVYLFIYLILFAFLFFMSNCGAVGVAFDTFVFLFLPEEMRWTFCGNCFARNANEVFRTIFQIGEECLFSFWAICEMTIEI